MLGGLVTPNPSVICTGHPECPQPGPGPGSLLRAGEVDGGHHQLPQCHWAGSPVGGAGVSLGRGTSQQSQRPPQLCPPAGCWQGLGELCRGRSLALAQLTLIYRYPKAAGVMLSPRVSPSSGVPSTPQPQLELHSDLTRFSSIIHILESPGRNYRKLRLFQTLSARQVKSSHTKQGNQNLQH